MEQEVQLNEHNKQEYPPMHSEEQNHEFKIIKGKTYRYDDEFKKRHVLISSHFEKIY